MSPAFLACIALVLEHEGGYQAVQSDRGNWTTGVVGKGELKGTNFGISAYCLAPDVLTLTAGLRWVRLGDVKSGDRLLAFDEQPERHGKLNLRRFRVAVVEEIGPVVLDASLITTTARRLIASNGHQWLCRRGTHRIFEWRRTDELLARPTTRRPQVRIGKAVAPWSVDSSWAAGYLAGVFDGEGHYQYVPGFTQREGSALAPRALAAAAELGIRLQRHHHRHGVWTYSVVSDRTPLGGIGVLGRIGSERLLDVAARKLVGRSIHSPYAEHDEVVSVEPVGEQELVGIRTSTGTLIADGYLSHNSYPELDIRRLTREQAVAIYHRDYWQRIRGDELPFPLAAVTLDAAVNSGVRRGIEWLQKALGVTADGQLGPVTMGAAARASDPLKTAARACRHRIQFLAQAKGFEQWGASWIQRTLDTYRLAIEGPQ